jgi:hypothetical protein
MHDTNQSLRKTDQGLEVPLGPGQYTELKVRRTQLSYYDLKTREIVRQGSKDLEVIFPQVQRPTERPIAHFKLMDGERERCKDSTPLGEKKIPIREVERAFRGLDALEQKAKEKDTARDAKLVIQDLRLPDPKVNPELYRYWGPRHQRRLVILWGCERPPGSSIPAKQAISKLKTEPNWAGALHVLAKATSVLIAVVGVFLWLQLIARWIVGPPLDLRPPRVVRMSFAGGKLEVGSQPKPTDAGVLSLSPVLLTIRDVRSSFDSDFPNLNRIDHKKISHFTGFVRAGDYKFHDPTNGKDCILGVRDVWGTRDEAIRASLVLDKRQVRIGEQLKISLEPSFPSGSIGQYEVAWKRVLTTVDDPTHESAEGGFTVLKEQPWTTHSFNESGRHYIFGAVQDKSGNLRNCVVDVVDVVDGEAAKAMPLPHPVQQPPAALVQKATGDTGVNKTEGEQFRVVMLGEKTQYWLDGKRKSLYPIKIFENGHESPPLTLLGKPSEDGFTPRLDTSVPLKALVNTSINLDDAIERTNRLFVTEEPEPEPEEPQFFTPLEGVTPHGLTIVKAFPTMKFADKVGYVLRAVPSTPEFFYDVKWTFEGPLGPKKKQEVREDVAEAVFFGVAGEYKIRVEAKITDGQKPGSEKLIFAEATLEVNRPKSMNPYENFLCWLAR